MFCCILVGFRAVRILLSAERGCFVLLQLCAVGSCFVLLYFGMVLRGVSFVVGGVGRSRLVGCVGGVAVPVCLWCRVAEDKSA